MSSSSHKLLKDDDQFLKIGSRKNLQDDEYSNFEVESTSFLPPKFMNRKSPTWRESITRSSQEESEFENEQKIRKKELVKEQIIKKKI